MHRDQYAGADLAAPQLPPRFTDSGAMALLLRCLRKDRGKRFATVSQFANELVKFAPRRSRLSAERIERLARAAGFSASVLALPPSSDNEAAAAATHPGTGTIGGFGHTRPAASTSKLRMGLVLATVLAAGAAGVVALRRPASDAAASGSQPLPSAITTALPQVIPTDTPSPQQVLPAATTPPVDSGVASPPSSSSASARPPGVKPGTVKPSIQTVASKSAGPSKPANPETKPSAAAPVAASAATQAVTPERRSRM